MTNFMGRPASAHFKSLACIALIGASSHTLAAEPANALHGAMPSDAQQQLLDSLGLNAAAPPRGVDAVAWATIYVPADNELTAERPARPAMT